MVKELSVGVKSLDDVRMVSAALDSTTSVVSDVSENALVTLNNIRVKGAGHGWHNLYFFRYQGSHKKYTVTVTCDDNFVSTGKQTHPIPLFIHFQLDASLALRNLVNSTNNLLPGNPEEAVPVAKCK